MDHADHLNLLRDGILSPGGVWADLGSGRGAFTLALADLLGPGGMIYAVDRDRSALNVLQRRMRAQYPEVQLHPITADFNDPLELPHLDGIVMANSLHFQPHPLRAVRQAYSYLERGGRFILVEYNLQLGKYPVPYPVPLDAWVDIARQTGFVSTQLLRTRPSSTMGEIYSACSVK
jgi:ubiquinone/menaquinone biosynthesis C-methylase UbiE